MGEMSMTASTAVPRADTWFDGVSWLDHSLLVWLITFGSALLAFLVLATALRLARRTVLPRAIRRRSYALRALAAALSGVRTALLLAIVLVGAVNALDLGPRIGYWTRVVLFALIGVQLVICINRALVAAILRSVDKSGPVPVMLSIVTWSVQFIVWLSFGLALLSTAGVHITAFVASLGVGGIAVALALQNILGDLFASIAIGLDKPFEPGEYIAFEDAEGTVQHIGVKSTRIRALTGEEISIANSQLLAKLTHNYSRMPERYVAFGFSVPFTTSRATIDELVQRCNDAIRSMDGVRFERGHLTGFGDDGFTVQFIYYMLDPSFVKYRDRHQEVTGQIIDICADLDVTIAVPARAVTMR